MVFLVILVTLGRTFQAQLSMSLDNQSKTLTCLNRENQNLWSLKMIPKIDLKVMKLDQWRVLFSSLIHEDYKTADNNSSFKKEFRTWTNFIGRMVNVTKNRQKFMSMTAMTWIQPTVQLYHQFFIGFVSFYQANATSGSFVEPWRTFLSSSTFALLSEESKAKENVEANIKTLY